MKEVKYKINMNESETKTLVSLLNLIERAFKYNFQTEYFDLQNEYKDMQLDYSFYSDALNINERLKQQIIKNK